MNKLEAHWPMLSSGGLAELTDGMPLQVIENEGLELLGAPIGTAAFMKCFLSAKINDVNVTLSQIENIHALIRFHLHRMTSFACRVQHIFRLTPLSVSFPFAQRFDTD